MRKPLGAFPLVVYMERREHRDLAGFAPQPIPVATQGHRRENEPRKHDKRTEISAKKAHFARQIAKKGPTLTTCENVSKLETRY